MGYTKSQHGDAALDAAGWKVAHTKRTKNYTRYEWAEWRCWKDAEKWEANLWVEETKTTP